MSKLKKYELGLHVRPDQIDSLLLGQNLKKKLTRVAGKKNLISMTPYLATLSCLHGKTSQQVKKKLHSSSKKVAKLQGRWQNFKEGGKTSRKVAKLQGRWQNFKRSMLS